MVLCLLESVQRVRCTFYSRVAARPRQVAIKAKNRQTVSKMNTENRQTVLKMNTELQSTPSVVRTRFPGNLSSLSDNQRARFIDEFKTQLASSSAEIQVSHIISVTLSAGSIVSTAVISASVPEPVVTELAEKLSATKMRIVVEDRVFTSTATSKHGFEDLLTASPTRAPTAIPTVNPTINPTVTPTSAPTLYALDSDCPVLRSISDNALGGHLGNSTKRLACVAFVGTETAVDSEQTVYSLF